MADKFYKGKKLSEYSKAELIQIAEELMATIHRLSVETAQEDM